uniref:Uncharacterized protein n=1 Tax=Setaria digitata TaxID=48799 RepID=A0A915PPC5_9BILA
MNFGKRAIDDNWIDMMRKDSDGPEVLHKKSNFDREFMNFGKRMEPFGRSQAYLNKKNINPNAFSREFLSFGRR